MEDNQVLLHSPPLSILKWVSKPLAIFTKGEKVEETMSSLATEAEARTNSELQQPQESTRLESQAPPESEAPNTSQTAPATMEDETTESDTEGFSLLQNGHKDMVETTAFNTSGDRFASGSVDGKIKVYNRHKDNTWHLCDTWGAHSSEILQVCYFSSPSSFQAIDIQTKST
jgi:WD40 repeat protein